MTRSTRQTDLRQRLLEILVRDGPAGSRVLCQALGVSQPTFSRLVRALGDEILVVGRSMRTLYALPRNIQGVPARIPVYEIRSLGEAPRTLATLHPVAPNGFYVEHAAGSGTFHEGIPWFLLDLAPAGFLGRLVPRRHPDLDLPDDVRQWSDDHVLRYITRYGWDLPGAFIVGEAAFATYLEQQEGPEDLVEAQVRTVRYPEIANQVFSFGAPGSSAGGEQPKFLATRSDGVTRTPVLVKFSPPGDETSSRRVADLLISEHMALETLRGHDLPAARSCVVTGRGRTFLEVERFDRDGVRHRRGTCTLAALDVAFIGNDLRSWSAAAKHLVRQHRLDHRDLKRVRLLELFGRLIGNTDMHFGNLAFYVDGTRPTGLAPAYDMLPMHFSPRGGEVPHAPHVLPRLSPVWADVALPAIDAAEDFWRRVAASDSISPEFRRIGAQSHERVAALRALASQLPM